MTAALPSKMTVIEITAPGGPEVLKAGERPLPAPEPDQVLIRVAAAGVNGPDLVQRRGVYPPPEGASDLPGWKSPVTSLPQEKRLRRFSQAIQCVP